MPGWQRSIDNTKIGQRQAKKGAFTELKASTDPVDEHGVGDKGFNDGLYMPKDLDVTTVTQPALNAAVSTAIVDTYGGVIITLTGAGNAQTLQTPTDAAVIKRFIVVIKGAFNIQVNGITMTGGEAQWFIWDSASWVAINAVDADDITFTPTGNIIATNVQAAIAEVDTEKLANIFEDTTPQLGGDLDPNSHFIGRVKGADIASASPLPIGTDGDYFDVTGNVGFAAMAVAANRHFFLHFDAILIMTHHATNLDLPGEANITTAAGDVGEFFSTGANTVQCVNYTRATGVSLEFATNTETVAFESETKAVTPEGLGYALAGHLAYGIEYDNDEPSPTLTRIGALAGIAAGSSPGNACLPIQAKMRRCLQADDGTVNYYLNASDSTKKEDGVTASVLTGADGQVMVEIPKFYHSYTYNATTHVHQRLISFVQLPGFTLHPAFWKNGAEVDFRYIGAYEGIGYDNSTSAYFDGDDVGNNPATNWPGGTAIDTVNDKLGSVSGFAPLVNETRAEFRAIAGNRGTSGWRQQDFSLVFAVQLLYLTEYASFDSQSMIGMGRTELSGGTWAKDSYIGVTGKSNGDGNGTNSVGGNSNNAYMTYRGIENFYGNVWKWVDGFNIGIGGGAHDGANNQAIMTDSGESFPVNGLIGATIKNTTDGSEGIITANNGTTITATLADGTDNDWDTGDTWEVSGIPYVSNDDTDFADDTATGTGGTYGRLTDINGDGITLPQGSNDWQKNLQQIKEGFLPLTLTGTSSTYVTDYYYQAAGWRVALFGGRAASGLAAGVACWSLDGGSADDDFYVSGRLCR